MKIFFYPIMALLLSGLVSCSSPSLFQSHRQIASKSLVPTTSCGSLFRNLVTKVRGKKSKIELAHELLEQEFYKPLNRDPEYLENVIRPKLISNYTHGNKVVARMIEDFPDQYKLGIMTTDTEPRFELYFMWQVHDDDSPSPRMTFYHPVYDKLESLFQSRAPREMWKLDELSLNDTGSYKGRQDFFKLIGKGKHTFYRRKMIFDISYPLDQTFDAKVNHRVFISFLKQGTASLYPSWREDHFYKEFLSHPLGRDVLNLAQGFIDTRERYDEVFDQTFLKRIVASNGEVYYIIRFKIRGEGRGWIDFNRHFILPTKEGLQAGVNDKFDFISHLSHVDVEKLYKGTQDLVIDLDSTRSFRVFDIGPKSTQVNKEDPNYPIKYYEEGSAQHIQRKVALLEIDGGLFGIKERFERGLVEGKGEFSDYLERKLISVERNLNSSLEISNEEFEDSINELQSLIILLTRTVGKFGVVPIQNQIAGVIQSFSRKVNFSKLEIKEALDHIEALLYYEYQILLQLRSANSVIRRKIAQELNLERRFSDVYADQSNRGMIEVIRSKLDDLIKYADETGEMVDGSLTLNLEETKLDILRLSELRPLVDKEADPSRVKEILNRILDSRIIQ